MTWFSGVNADKFKVKHNWLGYDVKLYDKTLTYTQDIDTWQSSNDVCQTLTIKTHRVDDGPNGSFLTLETTRWALDHDEIDKFCDELKKILKDV